MLRYLWATSLAFRLISFLIGVERRAPSLWLVWAGFYAATGVLLRVCVERQWGGAHGPYVVVWEIQQIVGFALLTLVVAHEAKPAPILVLGSGVIAATVLAMLQRSGGWPSGEVKETSLIVGCAALALGLISTAGLIARVTVPLAILSLYCLCYALLMLAASDYLTSNGLSRAWNLMDTGAFAAWTFWYTFRKERECR